MSEVESHIVVLLSCISYGFILSFFGTLDSIFPMSNKKEGNIMSKHHDKYCYTPMPCSYGNYGMGYYGGGGEAGCGGTYGGWGIRWIYALLVLIVIVLQFGRTSKPNVVATNPCGDGVVATTGCDGLFSGQLIDNSVLFIIVVFLLILCAGCWTGGKSNYGAAGGYGYGGGYGY